MKGFLCWLLSIHHQANLVTWYGVVLPDFAARNAVRDSGRWLRFYVIYSSRQRQGSSSSYMELSRDSNPKIMKYHHVKEWVFRFSQWVFLKWWSSSVKLFSVMCFIQCLGGWLKLSQVEDKDLSIYWDKVEAACYFEKSEKTLFHYAVQNQKTIRVLYRTLCYRFL
jgi:hypothetical protein